MQMRDEETPSTAVGPQVSPGVGDPYRHALRRQRPALVAVLGLSALINVLALTGSIYMLQVYDRVLSSRSIETLVGLFVIVVALYAFYTLFVALRTRFLSRIAFGLDVDLAAQSFGLGLEAARSDKPEPGAAGAAGDLTALRRFISGSGAIALLDLPFMPIFLAVLFVLHPWLGFLTVAGAGLAGVIAVVNRAVLKASAAGLQAADRAEARFAAESRTGAETILAMGQVAAVTRHWVALRNRALAQVQAGGDPSEWLAALSRGFRMLLQSAILTLGAVLVLRGDITPGMIVAASILSGRALAPVDQLIGQWRSIGQGAAAHRRLAASFAARPGRPAPLELPDPTGQITVDALTKLGSAASGVEPRRLLSHVSFSLVPGDGLGVIGDSASGKSTLARLLVGASLPDAGDVRFDGATFDQWAPERLGRIIGYLPQNPHFLPGTIHETIARFDPAARDQDVIDAAILAGIHDMILRLPQGYATRIGDPDLPPALSGGQLQRLGLARAIYGWPPIVVLDEPNSNLDMAGDAALTRTIAALRRSGSTVIVMAHRPSALEAVNKLMVLHEGQVRLLGEKARVLADLALRTPAAGAQVVDLPSRGDLQATPHRHRPAVVRNAGPRQGRREA